MWCLPSVRPNVSEMFKSSFHLHSPILKPTARFSTKPTNSSPYLPPLFSVAPMMDWTDNHYRTLARLIKKHAWLYTEMIATETLVHQQTNLDRFLAFPPHQHPIVLQIGGSNVQNLAKAAKLSDAYGYDEINLNCGCLSPKVADHVCFGVSLMLKPKLVGAAMSAIAANTNVPVTVKCRIGIDDHDSYDELCDFIYKVNAALKEGAHGVMVGRAAYNNPWQRLGRVDTAVYGVPSRGLTRRQVLEQYQVYRDSVLGTHGNGRPNVRDLVKPLLNLFHSENGNSSWKRRADAAFRECRTVGSLLEESLREIPDCVLDSPISGTPESGEEDVFPNVHEPYEVEEQLILCA